MDRRSIAAVVITAWWAALSPAAIPRSNAGEQSGERHESKVVFVAASDAEPYSQALDGFRSVFPNVTVVVLDPKDSLHTHALAALAPPVSLVIAAGNAAVEAVALSKTEAPMIATMVLLADRKSNNSWPPLVVHLDAAPSQIASEIADLFPARHRIATIWDSNEAPDSGLPAAKIANFYQRAGIQIVTCKSPEDLLPAFLSLRGKADFVLTRPDGSLYNSTTVKPLILASLEHRLPIIGFSASFVRGGAAVGLYPDFRDIGLQTAALAQKFLAGQVRAGYEGPRTWVVAVNQRVLRLLGLDYQHRPEVVVFR